MQKVVFGIVIVAILLAGYFSTFNDNTELQVSGDAIKRISNCQRLPPSVTVIPSTQTAIPGSQKYYSLIITNNNIGPGCGTSQFNLLDINHYAGWTTSISPTTFNICAGSFCQFASNYTVTSPLTAQQGLYDFYVIAYETGQIIAGTTFVDYVII